MTEIELLRLVVTTLVAALVGYLLALRPLKRTNEALDRIDRRSFLTLQIVADIANKTGITGRWSDILTKLLAESTEAKAP